MGKYDVIVVGAGAGGLVIAIGAAKAGKRVLLVEKNLYGGDYTNFGCIPSKALITAARNVYSVQRAEKLGLKIPPLYIDTSKVLESIPKSMIFIGGGPICIELAQAFSRLWSKVSIVERELAILAREDFAAKFEKKF